MTDPTNTGNDDREGDSLVPQLPQDNSTPFGAPDDATNDDNTSSQLDDTHPATDAATNIDSQELYDEGLSGAVEAEDPEARNQ